MPISGGRMKNPLNILKAYLKRSRISTLNAFRKKSRDWQEQKRISVSIFPSIISLSCLVFCKYLIYTFSDIKTLLFVFLLHRRQSQSTLNCRKLFLDFFLFASVHIEETNRRKLKFKDNDSCEDEYSNIVEGIGLEAICSSPTEALTTKGLKIIFLTIGRWRSFLKNATWSLSWPHPSLDDNCIQISKLNYLNFIAFLLSSSTPKKVLMKVLSSCRRTRVNKKLFHQKTIFHVDCLIRRRKKTTNLNPLRADDDERVLYMLSCEALISSQIFVLWFSRNLFEFCRNRSVEPSSYAMFFKMTQTCFIGLKLKLFMILYFRLRLIATRFYHRSQLVTEERPIIRVRCR